MLALHTCLSSRATPPSFAAIVKLNASCLLTITKLIKKSISTYLFSKGRDLRVGTEPVVVEDHERHAAPGLLLAADLLGRHLGEHADDTVKDVDACDAAWQLHTRCAMTLRGDLMQPLIQKI